MTLFRLADNKWFSFCHLRKVKIPTSVQIRLLIHEYVLAGVLLPCCSVKQFGASRYRLPRTERTVRYGVLRYRNIDRSVFGGDRGVKINSIHVCGSCGNAISVLDFRSSAASIVSCNKRCARLK